MELISKRFQRQIRNDFDRQKWSINLCRMFFPRDFSFFFLRIDDSLSISVIDHTEHAYKKFVFQRNSLNGVCRRNESVPYQMCQVYFSLYAQTYSFLLQKIIFLRNSNHLNEPHSCVPFSWVVQKRESKWSIFVK